MSEQGKPKPMFYAKNSVDDRGLATGGIVEGPGIQVKFAPRFVNESMSDEEKHDGTTVKALLAAIEQRLIFEMEHGARSREAALVLTKVQEASHWSVHTPLARAVDAPPTNPTEEAPKE